MPLISVIIPAYNAERTILETITSVQQQTFSNFEIIVIDDGSKDKTLDILNSIVDERLKIFSYQNSGVSAARNHGISHATGDFLSFLDADDLWTADKLELQFAALQQHPEAGVAYSWTHFMDEQGKSFHSDKPLFLEGNVYTHLLVRNFLANGSNPLIRRQAVESVGEFDTEIPPAEDWDFYLRLAARWSFVLVPKLQILYRQSSSSGSSKVEVLEKSSLKVIEKAFHAAPSELQPLKNQSLSGVYMYGAELFLRHATNHRSEIHQAGQRLWMAIYLYPQCLLTKEVQNLIKWWVKKWILVKEF